MAEQRSNGHTVSRFTVHLVWSTKYRYGVLQGDVKIRCRTLLVQICDAEDAEILKREFDVKLGLNGFSNKNENPASSSFAVARYSCTIQTSLFLPLKI